MTRNGRWWEEWTWQIGSSELKGVLKGAVHYYEDGNVQMSVSKGLSLALTCTTNASEKEIAQELTERIQESGHRFQEAINELHAQLSETIFKGLRRALPITRTRIDWYVHMRMYAWRCTSVHLYMYTCICVLGTKSVLIDLVDAFAVPVPINQSTPSYPWLEVRPCLYPIPFNKRQCVCCY